MGLTRRGPRVGGGLRGSDFMTPAGEQTFNDSSSAILRLQRPSSAWARNRDTRRA